MEDKGKMEARSSDDTLPEQDAVVSRLRKDLEACGRSLPGDHPLQGLIAGLLSLHQEVMKSMGWQMWWSWAQDLQILVHKANAAAQEVLESKQQLKDSSLAVKALKQELAETKPDEQPPPLPSEEDEEPPPFEPPRQPADTRFKEALDSVPVSMPQPTEALVQQGQGGGELALASQDGDSQSPTPFRPPGKPASS